MEKGCVTTPGKGSFHAFCVDLDVDDAQKEASKEPLFTPEKMDKPCCRELYSYKTILAQFQDNDKLRQVCWHVFGLM